MLRRRSLLTAAAAAVSCRPPRHPSGCYHPIRQMQLMKWTGSTWDAFGDIIEGGST